MTRDDAARLVNLLISTWPTGPRAYVWTQAIGDLDATPANRAYAELRDTVERITIAAYVAAYHAQLRTASAPHRRTPRADCERCDGTGYVDGPDEYETIGGEPHAYATVVPCRCRGGRQPAPAQPANLFGGEP